MEERRGADASRGYRRVLGRPGGEREKNVRPGAGGHTSSRMYIAFSLVCILFVFDAEQISATCTCIRCAARRRPWRRERERNAE